MVTVYKSEWHQVEKRYSLEVDEALLSEVYPDLDEDEIADLLETFDVEELVSDALDLNITFDWNWDDDDWWTDRKGGYEVTYDKDES
jgi:hypothetical protein